jgi:hypothetical protein
MSLFLIAAVALIALQFTSGIGQWISENQQATQTLAKLQWLASKIGLAPAIITTRVLVIAAFVLLYFFVSHAVTIALFAGAGWYLYKTGKYIVIWHQVTAGVQTVVDNTAKDVVQNVVKDVSNTVQADASAAAAAKGVDVSKLA